MVDRTTEFGRRERSITLPCNNQFLSRCHEMLRSISTRSTASVPSDKEMYEIISRTASEEELSSISRSDFFISNDYLNSAFHQPSVQQTTYTRKPKHRKRTLVRNTLSHLKDKIKLSHNERIPIDAEKDNGYLVVENFNSDLVLLPNINIDIQDTRHPQPCVQINDDNFDINQIQVSLEPSIAESFLAISPPVLGLSIKPVDNHSNNELEIQLTRSSVECGIPEGDIISINNTQASSTDSLSHEFSGVDRSTLDNEQYIQAQQLDLERLTIIQIHLNDEFNDLQFELQEISSLNHSYDEALKQNQILRKEFEELKGKYERMCSPWSCKFCTFYNEPYDKTGRDVCEVCDSPSPLKQATLTK